MDPWDPYNDEYPPPKQDEPDLHRAARLGDGDAIRRLVEVGKDINAEFDFSLDPDARPVLATPLMVAAGSGDGSSIETVQLLVELGANPKQTTASGSAASFACTGLGWNYNPGGDADRLRYLLSLGSPLSPESARSGLCSSAGDGDVERVSALLDLGVSPNPLWNDAIAEQRRESMNSNMTSQAPLELTGESVGLLGDAAAGFDESMADIEKSMREEFLAAVSSGPWGDEIPLFRAAESGSAPCVELLLGAGADPMMRDTSRRTAMYVVTSEAAANALLKAGIPLEDADEYGWSPLTNAVSDGELGLKIARALLAVGADPNATADHGYTVFMSAVGGGRSLEMLRLLIENGADPHAVSEYGYNAYHAAIDMNGPDLSEVRETLGYLAELGVDIEHVNKAGHSPLSRAIAEGYATEVRALCELGADVNAPCMMVSCEDGACKKIEHPAILAASLGPCANGDEKTLALLEHGADPLSTDDEGFTGMQRSVSNLCRDADHDECYKAFFTGLFDLRIPEGTNPTTKSGFIEAALPPIRTHVEEFASSIPITDHGEYGEQIRGELVNTIAYLAIYEGWARRELPHE